MKGAAIGSGRGLTGLALAAALLLLLVPVPSLAGGYGWRGRGHHHHSHHGHHVYRSHRPHVVIGLGPLWWGPRYVGPPVVVHRPYVYRPPAVIFEEPPVYVERPAASPAAPAGYWYYCQSAGRYYPDVPTCPEPWVQVPPRVE